MRKTRAQPLVFVFMASAPTRIRLLCATVPEMHRVIVCLSKSKLRQLLLVVYVRPERLSRDITERRCPWARHAGGPCVYVSSAFAAGERGYLYRIMQAAANSGRNGT